MYFWIILWKKSYSTWFYWLAKNLGDRSINCRCQFEPRVLATLSEEYTLPGNKEVTENSVMFSFFRASSIIWGLGRLETNLPFFFFLIQVFKKYGVECWILIYETRPSANYSACGSIFALSEFSFGLVVAGMRI